MKRYFRKIQACLGRPMMIASPVFSEFWWRNLSLSLEDFHISHKLSDVIPRFGSAQHLVACIKQSAHNNQSVNQFLEQTSCLFLASSSVFSLATTHFLLPALHINHHPFIFSNFSQMSNANLFVAPKGIAEGSPATNHLKCRVSSCKGMGVFLASGLAAAVIIEWRTPVPPLGFPKIYEGRHIGVIKL